MIQQYSINLSLQLPSQVKRGRIYNYAFKILTQQDSYIKLWQKFNLVVAQYITFYKWKMTTDFCFLFETEDKKGKNDWCNNLQMVSQVDDFRYNKMFVAHLSKTWLWYTPRKFLTKTIKFLFYTLSWSLFYNFKTKSAM